MDSLLEKIINNLPSDFEGINRKNLLNKKIFKINKNDIINKIKNSYELSLDILYDINDTNLKIKNDNMPHPLIFEIGHVALFYDNFVNRFLNVYPLKSFSYKFDSIYNLPDRRLKENFPDLITQFEYLKNVITLIEKYLNNLPENLLDPILSYLLIISYLHHQMHLEVFYFLKDQLRLKSNKSKKFESYKKDIELTFIKIKNDKYIQGKKYENNDFITWDNECPSFEININNFLVSKYLITCSQYLEFISVGGYNNKKYWSKEGWRFIKENEIYMPANWIMIENKFYRKHFDKIYELEMDFPVMMISQYEAEAFANYHNCRLPTETELEYLMTNCGKSKYPWGNSTKSGICNNNYSGDICSVLDFQNDKNVVGVFNLFGNVWQWTKTVFYPYPGYQIDPCYERFSYPFFFFRTIVKGSSWATNFDLTYPQYRNSQPKETRFQYIGFRIVKDI